jgi:AcrR family transcriptional regulator
MEPGTEPAKEPARRRDRLRTATVAEIKDLAWAQIAESGAASLSLRAIARNMGMTSSALYRYFESRDQLLAALSREGFASLADALEAAEAAFLARPARQQEAPGLRFLEVVRAYREWALSHPTEYALIFGTPIPGFDEHGPEAKEEMFRGVAVLFRTIIGGLQSGAVKPPPILADVLPSLRPKLRAWNCSVDQDLSDDTLAACMFAWTHIHGAISLELFGRLPPQLLPSGDLFEHQMHEVLNAIGCQPVTKAKKR